MANLKNIQRKIKSVQNTGKITRAMKLVSTAKLKRAEELAKSSREYAAKLNNVLSNIACNVNKFDISGFGYDARLFTKSENVKVVDIIFITSDKGLCGGFNSQTIKAAKNLYFSLKAEGKTVRMRGIGRKGVDNLKFNQIDLADVNIGVSGAPSYEKAQKIIAKAFSDFIDGKTDRVVIIYNGFKSMISQEVREIELLPIDFESVAGTSCTSAISTEPDDSKVIMSSLRQFSDTQPLYTLADDGTLTNNQSGVKYRPNNDIGFYQSITADGKWGDDKLSPGYTVTIGWDNFTRVFTDEGIQKPFFAIFVWTVVFSVLTVILTVAVGMVLACLVQWESLKGKAIYRVLLILPYAVPSFISILIFKGLFNQSFGEINMMLSALFGIKPAWFSDPTTARSMIIIVNTWLGYPYMMILCMGLLKAIPDDLYEASAMDGAGPFQNFFKITLPLLIKPLTPLMIASFAFNFNNFVLIQLLTNGGPDRLGTTTPAGYTDLLVSYTYRIAFEGGGGQDFGLAAAIATLIFLLVGALAIVNLKATRMKFD